MSVKDEGGFSFNIDIEDALKKLGIVDKEANKVTNKKRSIKIDTDFDEKQLINVIDKINEKRNKINRDFYKKENYYSRNTNNNDAITAIHNFYQKLSSEIQKGDEVAANALQKKMIDYWKSVEKMPSNNKLLSGMTKDINGKNVEVLPKAFAEVEKAIISENLALKENQEILGQVVKMYSTEMPNAVHQMQTALDRTDFSSDILSNLKRDLDEYYKLSSQLKKYSSNAKLEDSYKNRWAFSSDSIRESDLSTQENVLNEIANQWKKINRLKREGANSFDFEISKKDLAGLVIIYESLGGSIKDLQKNQQALLKPIYEQIKANEIAANASSELYEKESIEIEKVNAQLREKMNLISKGIINKFGSNLSNLQQIRVENLLDVDSFERGKNPNIESLFKSLVNILGVEIPQASEKTKTSLNEVTEAEHKIAESSRKIDSGSDGIRELSEEQRKVSTTSEQMSNVAKETSDSIKKESDIIESTSERMKKLAESKKEVIEANEKLAQTALQTTGDLGKEEYALNEAGESAMENAVNIKNSMNQSSDSIQRTENASKELREAINGITSDKLNKPFNVYGFNSDEFNGEISKIVEAAKKADKVITSIQAVTKTGTKLIDENDIHAGIKIVEKLDRAIVKYIDDANNASQAIYKLETFGKIENGKAVDSENYWVQDSSKYIQKYQSDTENIEKVIKDRDNKISNLTIKQNKILTDIENQRIKNNISSESFEVLKNSNNDIIEMINSLSNVTSGKDLSRKFNEINEAIESFRNTFSRLKTQDTGPGQLKSNDVYTSFVTLSNGLDTLESKIRVSGVEIVGDIKKYVDESRAIIDNGFDKNNPEMSRLLESVRENIKKAKAELDKLKQIKKEADTKDSLGAKKSSLLSSITNFENKNPGFDKWKTEINGVEVSVQSLIEKINNLQSVDGISAIRDQVKALKDDFNAVNNFSGKAISALNKFQIGHGLDIDAGTLTNIDRIDEKLRELAEAAKSVDSQTGLDKFKQNLKEVQALINNENKISSWEKQIADLEKADGKIEKYKQDLNEIRAKIGEFQELDIVTDREKQDAKDMASTIGKMIKDMGSVNYDKVNKQGTLMPNLTGIEDAKRHFIGLGYQIIRSSETTNEFTAQIRKLNGETKTVKVTFDQLAGAVRVATNSQNLNGLTKQMSTFQWMVNGLKNTATQFFRIYASPMDFVRYFRQGIDVLKEYDSALTGVSYTMDLGKRQLKELGESTLKLAKNLSASTENAYEVMQIYANMNTSAKEMQEMASPALILSNLTGSSASDMADTIQAVTNSFGESVGDAQHIADVLDYISQNLPLSYSKGIQGMSEAIEVAGATAEAAGVSFEQLSSIVGNAQATTRQAGSQIGNALKTIFSRLSKASTMDETVDNETLSNASKALHAINIEVYDSKGNFNDFDEILTQLANKWDTLTDAQQAYGICLDAQKCA